jgi:glutamine synthetase
LVICDCTNSDGNAVELSPRQVLKRVLRLYEACNWAPIVAPELEFFLVQSNPDPDLPLQPPVGRSGRPEVGRQSYGIDAVNEFEQLIEDLYDYCDLQNLDVDTVHHESGAAQMEINFLHNDPISLADQVFLFKRTVRQTALRHDVYATFMAKPMEKEPGSAMHIHQSIIDNASGQNLFVTQQDTQWRDSDMFRWYIGGLQRFLPFAILMIAPNVNSYRRLVPDYSAPINTLWGYDNRTAGLRVPYSSPESRRVENRLSGADANPYLAIAASLACGFLGMQERVEPSAPIQTSGYSKSKNLPRHLPDAIAAFGAEHRFCDVFGRNFVENFISIKQAEWDAYNRVISSWEREYLLLNV